MMIRSQLLTLVRQRLFFWLIGIGGIVCVPPVGVLLIGGLGSEGAAFESVFAGVLAWYAIAVSMMLGTLIGATAGSVDYASGVMRDYVATGVERWKIHFSQLIAGGIYLNVLMLAGLLLSGLAALIVSGGQNGAYSEDIPLIRAVIATMFVAWISIVISHSLGSIIRSRGITIAVIATYLVGVENILAFAFGGDRLALRSAASGVVMPLLEPESNGSGMGEGALSGESVEVALIVLVAWLTIAVVAALARLYRSDL